MIKFEKYYNNLYFMYLLFNNNLLKNVDIFEIANVLANNGEDSEFLIDILLDGPDSESISYNFNNYLKTKDFIFVNEDGLIKRTILFIFNEIILNNISLMDGIKFVIENFVEQGKSKKYFSDYLNISDIISVYYTIDDGDIKNREDINEAIKLLKNLVKDYLFKYKTEGFYKNGKV